MKFQEALKELREKTKKRDFDQTLDLIISLKDFDVKRESQSIILTLPNKIKKVRFGAFLENKGKYDSIEQVITRGELDTIPVKEMKRLSKKVDFFISNAKLMPLVASKLGKILGSAGKMPDPKIGCVVIQEDSETIKKAIEKLSNLIKIKPKEPSIKIAMGKESMKDETLIQNMEYTIKTITANLPKKELNIRKVMIKFTMSHPIKVLKE